MELKAQWSAACGSRLGTPREDEPQSNGGPRMADGAITCPALIAHVARKAHEDSELPRQQQKALEARGLAAPEKKV